MDSEDADFDLACKEAAGFSGRVMIFGVFFLLSPAAFTSSLNTNTFSILSVFSSLPSSVCRVSVREFAHRLLGE